MSNMADISNEIAELSSQVLKLKEELIDIETAIDYILKETDLIETESISKMQGYDMTQGSEWLGNLERDAEQYRGMLIDSVAIAQNQSGQLICDMRNVTKVIKNKIEESLRRISILEAEQSTLSEAI